MVNTGLLSYLPLPRMPFDTHETVVFQDTTPKNRVVEESKAAIEAKAQKYKHEEAYTYHPHNMNKVPQRVGENVDFIVWG